MKNVKNIVCNKVNLPKLGLGQKTRINRNKLIENVKKGDRYTVPFVATFNNGDTYDSIFKIVKAFKEDGKDIIIVEEEILGQFGVLYDSFINGNFKGEFNSAWQRMENNREYLRKELDRKTDDYIEQKNLHTYYKDNYKEEKKAHDETKGLMVIKDNEIVALKEKLEKIDDVINMGTGLGARDLLKGIRILTASGKDEDTIEKFVVEFIKKNLKNLMK